MRVGIARVGDGHRGAEHGSRTIPAGAGCSEAEHGSGTVLAVVLGFVVMICMAAALTLAQAMAMAHRAASAADLAALAGADAARGLTTGDPCVVASETAARHGASLSACTAGEGGIVEIRTELDRGAVFGTATGRSRAGPPP
ncbi:secretion/DNA translocation related TadE-like protein [Arthrobacter sp. GAS37]|uniref:Rv3654c family TadE-like protein n=1 Tax=Arthrobacter sp. GAS37 TaxID=3156261 RepID=UPI003834317D